jgi:putative ABC transport system permease protein
VKKDTGSLTMLRNTFKVTLRLLKRQKGFTVINLGGLALGLAASLLMSLFIRDELSFDRFYTKSKRIYRLGSTVGWPYGNLILETYPEVGKVVYMQTYPAYPIKKDQQLRYE